MIRAGEQQVHPTVIGSKEAMFRNILYPFDGTAKCMAAVPQILPLVRLSGAQLRILYVNRGVTLDVLTLQDLRSEITEALRVETGVPEPIFATAEGEASEAIVRYADENNIDLIAMPTRGLNRCRRLFTRSVTESVLDKARCPVWTIPGRLRNEPKTSKILCAVGHARDAAFTLRTAGRIAKRMRAQLTLVYAVPTLNEGTLARMSQDPPFLSTAAALRYLQTMAYSAGVHADFAAEIGAEGQVYERVARRIDADLLILDESVRRRSMDIPRWSRRAKCPVLVTNVDFEQRMLRKKSAERVLAIDDPAFADIRLLGRR